MSKRRPREGALLKSIHERTQNQQHDSLHNSFDIDLDVDNHNHSFLISIPERIADDSLEARIHNWLDAEGVHICDPSSKVSEYFEVKKRKVWGEMLSLDDRSEDSPVKLTSLRLILTRSSDSSHSAGSPRSHNNNHKLSHRASLFERRMSGGAKSQ